ncbi:MAG: hypothetical protein CMJ64_14340 [Planctomycetaceae bacterium]|nr:hypothetical protein [Planctomycetaceae bacterium]
MAVLRVCNAKLRAEFQAVAIWIKDTRGNRLPDKLLDVRWEGLAHGVIVAGCVKSGAAGAATGPARRRA